MKNIAKISIIMPNYNSQNYLRETIKSITQQTYQNWELIIVDDNSNIKTKNILNEENLKKLPPGSFVINAARGGHIVESDLLKLLDDGHIGGAALDVFEIEPLPQKNLLWTHPKVTVTPHVAALVNLESAAKVISETIYCCRNGLPLKNIVDPIEGY